MRAVVQVVAHANVAVDGEVLGKIGRGFLIFLGISDRDTEETADKMVRKICSARILPDAEGKTNLSLHDIDGELLVISQFTLYADCRKGNRPSFTDAGAPEHANRLYEYFMEKCRGYVPVVEKGRFGADMKVSLLNDGPFTLMLDSDTLF